MKYAKFLTASNHAYTVIAEMREVKNPNHKNFGKWSICADMQYNPLHEKILGLQYFTKEESIKLLTDLGFIQVKEDFDAHNEDNINEIRDQLSAEWIELFELWKDYTG